MCSRGVWQMHSLVVKYCPRSDGSKGVRQALRTALPAFAAANPQVLIKATPLKSFQKPTITAFYMEPNPPAEVDCNKMSAEEVLSEISRLRDRIGYREMLYKRNQIREFPTLQGYWDAGIATSVDYEIKGLNEAGNPVVNDRKSTTEWKLQITESRNN